jgi:hypothetical protein
VIEDLQRQLGEKKIEPPKPPPELKKGWYKPIKGDLVDELIAKYFNDMPYAIPIKRFGDGNYLFGTKKIFAKIMQGKLVIRVGGGFMSIDEFINTYADFEVTKCQQLIEKGLLNLEEYVNGNYSIIMEYQPGVGSDSPNSKLH